MSRQIPWTTVNKAANDSINNPLMVSLLDVDTTESFADLPYKGTLEYSRRVTITHRGASGDPDVYFRLCENNGSPTPPSITTTFSSSPTNVETNGIPLSAGEKASFSFSSTLRLIVKSDGPTQIAVVFDDKPISNQ